MELDQKILEYTDTLKDEQLDLLLTLAQIPAPSGNEEKRAEFCKNWLEDNGAEGVYIDDALNVIYPVGVTDDKPLVVFAAHSDVVFPDTDTLPLEIKDGKVFCPGVGDDTASVSALLLAARYVAQKKLISDEYGILFVVNSCEEGLGNLKGTRKLFGDYGERIKEFVTFDSHNCHAVTEAVGSKRFKIEIDTEGGHSYGAFGNRNAIAYLASLIDTLYTVKVPEKGRTTYNVGTISGGTSVNTIAQHAEMLYEFRSNCRESMDIMQKHLDAAIEFYRAKGVAVTVTPVGDRPCQGDVDEDGMKKLMDRAAEATRRYFDREIRFSNGSTDCNIPLSMGIPAICVGCYDGAGAHTREEYIVIDSLPAGLKFAFDMMLFHF
ncbi:MAG: M20/M25/M40 family metallo-hydrolase [Clostridia bacterium]|nr:M20/M25/M40 family metallo-hydrolase [Clostridia bacterium]